MNLNYFFHPDMLEKKTFLSVYFVVFGNLIDLCLTWTWFLMISGNPSSKCQRVWLKIRPTIDISICTELKELIS